MQLMEGDRVKKAAGTAGREDKAGVEGADRAGAARPARGVGPDRASRLHPRRAVTRTGLGGRLGALTQAWPGARNG